MTTDDAVMPRLCTQGEMESPHARELSAALGEPWRLHRKLWEFVAIARAFRAEAPKPARAIGFGVGREPLAAFFAGLGTEVVATDQAAGGAWAATSQHAAGLDDLRRQSLCGPDDFKRRVMFRNVDMNAIPDDLLTGSFDFAWSSCAFEHLGSIEAGLAFFRRQMHCLRAGGLAVHTTEYNLHSNDATRDHDGTVIFRRRDIERLTAELRADGHAVVQPNFARGCGLADDYVDGPPFDGEWHLNKNIDGAAATSFVMTARRGA